MALLGLPTGAIYSDARDDQPQVPMGAPAGKVPEPFRRLTITDRHPTEPRAHYAPEERSLLCEVCGVPEIHWPTHRAGLLHHERARAAEGSARMQAPTAHCAAGREPGRGAEPTSCARTSSGSRTTSSSKTTTLSTRAPRGGESVGALARSSGVGALKAPRSPLYECGQLCPAASRRWGVDR
ncbi:hypothetical protein HPB47_002090 [Ixodes persulcatus]|uniref:Uncharacterized protein n=1 Tax=Ixodes persulcatus TaxID=34615 RepID=A0AC60PM90_IXOPE|nr:hypothetical protein HPB47_002090 [Ixodes persulcatus]